MIIDAASLAQAALLTNQLTLAIVSNDDAPAGDAIEGMAPVDQTTEPWPDHCEKIDQCHSVTVQLCQWLREVLTWWCLEYIVWWNDRQNWPDWWVFNRKLPNCVLRNVRDAVGNWMILLVGIDYFYW